MFQENIEIRKMPWSIKHFFKKYKCVTYCGWIYGNKRDEDLLRSLGIEGKMKWKDCADEFVWKKRSINRSTGEKTEEFGPTHLEEHGVRGIFEYCEIKEEKIDIVINNCKMFYHLFEPGTFTGVDERGKQLHKSKQKMWKMDLLPKDEAKKIKINKYEFIRKSETTHV